MSLPFAAPTAPVDFGRPELPAERRAAILALLLTPDCPRERQLSFAREKSGERTVRRGGAIAAR